MKMIGARASLVMVSALYAAALLADFLAPYPYAAMHDRHGFHPPMLTRIHCVDETGRWVRPFVYGIAISDPMAKGYAGYTEDRTTRYPIRFFVRGEARRMLSVIPTQRRLFGVDSPGRLYLLGSDQFGRDLFSRILEGAKVSLSVGLAGAALSMLIGISIGGVAGYRGGQTDFLLMRAAELMLAVPSLYLLLILRQSLGDELRSTHLHGLIVLILALIGWTPQARVTRGMVLALREREFVIAARALGASAPRLLFRHMLPNALPVALATATAQVPVFILSEAALSFLGLGIAEPAASWGNLLAAAQNVRALTDFTWLLLPGLFLFAAVLAWNRLGDALRDATDPRGGDHHRPSSTKGDQKNGCG
jgi:peptide/nickel transport system permease protein